MEQKQAKNYVFIISSEFLTRIITGLGEIPTKFGAAVLEDLLTQKNIGDNVNDPNAKPWLDALDQLTMGNRLEVAKAAQAALDAQAAAKAAMAPPPEAA